MSCNICYSISIFITIVPALINQLKFKLTTKIYTSEYALDYIEE